ncbi:MAG: Eco29kI family restriction endonuclease [Rhodobacteraceae bacterium]|nr:Eco29kI family restriction endonuclease [Paracoccaceae bacterium]
MYVGKADFPGKRQGRDQESPKKPPAVFQRLSTHAGTIQSADNLELEDFSCRWLILDPVWIGLTEQVLISEYRPIWNSIVTGFGNNDPGSGRYNQRRSLWDTLHPGREWAMRLQGSNQTVADILENIKWHELNTR